MLEGVYNLCDMDVCAITYPRSRDFIHLEILFEMLYTSTIIINNRGK